MFSIVNLSQDQSKLSQYLSETLLSEIESTLKGWEKVLLYLNKRGSHSSSVCRDCGYIWMCPNCDVSLSVHQAHHTLLCHICSSSFSLPIICPSCHGNNISFVGVGTQQIESILQKEFIKAQMYRFDSDSMKTVWEKKNALTRLSESDIIIGTKMLTTGFNFAKVGLIAVILVEQELNSFHFDSEEKAYQNLKQLIGRGNRIHQKTHIILQSFTPNHRLIKQLTEQSYRDTLPSKLTERKLFHYPPYSEIVILDYRHEEKNISQEKLSHIIEKLKLISEDSNFQIIFWGESFKKNNLYHTRAILKWKNIRWLIRPIEKDILKNPLLSVEFSN